MAWYVAAGVILVLFLWYLNEPLNFNLQMLAVSLYCIYMAAFAIRTILHIDKRRKEREQPRASVAEKRQTFLEEQERQAELAEQARAENIQSFVDFKMQKVEDALFTRNFDRAMILFDEMMEKTDPENDAIERHFALLRMLEKLYSIREENPVIYDLCLKICLKDFENMENFIRKYNKDSFLQEQPSGKRLAWPLDLVTPTKAAIIYEKKEKLLAAIRICDMAIQWNAVDTNGLFFEDRKARLEKKLAESAGI